MKAANCTICIWSHPGRSLPPGTPVLMEAAERYGGWAAVDHCRDSLQGVEVAYVNGARDDLWWEFSLASSFRWQALVHHMAPETSQRRMQALTEGLEIDHLLPFTVQDLTDEQRALADLAVALLPKPQLLVWEEPFAHLKERSARLAADLVRVLGTVDGLTALLVSSHTETLKGGGNGERSNKAGTLDHRHFAGYRPFGRHAAAGWALRA